MPAFYGAGCHQRIKQQLLLSRNEEVCFLFCLGCGRGGGGVAGRLEVVFCIFCLA